ncbi:MAG: 6,7-dimethyl-8-ribityllumazine synthase [Candidatus Levyibacteriota bacterium]
MLKTQTKANFDKTFIKSLKIAIVRTTYHREMVENLETYAKDMLIEAGLREKNIQTFIAPGSWEVPLLAQAVAKKGKFDAIIAFGVIVKGETYHFEMLANEVGRALMQLSIDYSLPIAMEILAVFDKKHAQERAGKNNKNKGIEAANAVLQTLQELKKITAK